MFRHFWIPISDPNQLGFSVDRSEITGYFCFIHKNKSENKKNSLWRSYFQFCDLSNYNQYTYIMYVQASLLKY